MDNSSLDLENVGNLGISEGAMTLDNLLSSLPNGIAAFDDGALHQLVLTGLDATVSIIARENLVYELFFQLMRPDQLITGVYNQFVYTPASENERMDSNAAAISATVHCRLEQSGTMYLPIVHDSYQRLLQQQTTGVEQLPKFDNTRAVHCLRVNPPPCCAALNDMQSIKSIFDMLNIRRLEPSASADGTPGFASGERLEMTFRVSKLATAQVTAKPLDISYIIYTFGELCTDAATVCDNAHAFLAYTKHAVSTDQQIATRANLIPVQLNDALTTVESEVFRRVDSLYRRVQLPDDAHSTVMLVECPACRIQFFDLTEYVQHTLVTHDDRHCVFCDAEMANYEQLVQHHLPQCVAYAHRAAVLRADTSNPEDIYARVKADLERFFDAPTQNLSHSNTCETSASASTSLRAGDANGYVSETMASCNASFSTFERGGGPAGDEANGERVTSIGIDTATSLQMGVEEAERQPELIAVQRGRGPIQIYGDFSCKFCGRLCKTYIGLKSHVTQGHREFYNKLLLHTLEKVKEIQLEQVHADSAEAERLRMLDFDAAWSARVEADADADPEVELDLNGNVTRMQTRTILPTDNSQTLQWERASHAFFHTLTVEMLQLAFERVLHELENGVGLLNDEVRLEQIRSRIGDQSTLGCESAIGANSVQADHDASVIEWRSSVNGEIKRIDERNKRSAAFVAYRKRIQQTTELIKMMERASLGDSNKRGLWNVLDVERLFQYVSGEQVQAVSKLPSRYSRGKRPRGRPPKPSTLGLPDDATAEEIQEAQLELHARRLRSAKKMRISPNEVHKESNTVTQSNFVTRSLSRRGRVASASDNRNRPNVNEYESDDAFLARCGLENGQVFCASCGTYCDNREMLLEHRRLMHLNEVIFVCDADACHKCFSSLMLLSEHRKVHAAAQPSTSMHNIDKCPESAQGSIAKSEPQLYVCKFCSLSFCNEVFLLTHHKQVHKKTKSDEVHNRPAATNDCKMHSSTPNDTDCSESNQADGNRNTLLRSLALNSVQQLRVINAKTNTTTATPLVITPAKQQDAARPKGVNVSVLDATSKQRSSQPSCAVRNQSGFTTPPKLIPMLTLNAAKRRVDSVAAGSTQATAGNTEVVYRCGLCEILFASLAEVIAHQREFQVAQLRDKRLKELAELRKREQELLICGSQDRLTHQQPDALTGTRDQMNVLEQELSGAQVARYFCSICRTVFTSECVANQHARQKHTTTRRSSEKIAHVNASQVSVSPSVTNTAELTLHGDTGVSVTVE